MDPELKNVKEKKSNYLSNDSDVSEPHGIRRDSIVFDGIVRFHSESELYIILPCGIIFWTILLLL